MHTQLTTHISKAAAILAGRNGGEAVLNEVLVEKFVSLRPAVDVIRAIVGGGFIGPDQWPIFDGGHTADGHTTPDGTYYEQYHIIGEILPVLARNDAGSAHPTHHLLSWKKKDGTFKYVRCVEVFLRQ